MKLGKKTNESIPHDGWRAGFTPVGSSARFTPSGLSQGPNNPLRRTRSIGLTVLMSLGGDMPPHDETMPCGPSMP